MSIGTMTVDGVSPCCVCWSCESGGTIEQCELAEDRVRIEALISDLAEVVSEQLANAPGCAPLIALMARAEAELK